METSTESGATGSSAHAFSQVVFIDIPHSYPPATPITCSYTLTAAFNQNSRDWVGIFKVGWSTTKDYHTFVWVETCADAAGQQSLTRQAVFKEYYLPKDEIEFYQFCYIDSAGQVRGASTPFCFRNPPEPSLESSTDNDLLVITTQEQVEQSVREKDELQKKLQQVMEENETLRSSLVKEQREAASLKEQKEKDMSQQLKEMSEIKEENEKLKSILQQQQKENEKLKEEMSIQTAKEQEMQQHQDAEQKKMSSNSDDMSKQIEKYDRAVMKINQLKEEREELRKKLDSQSVEIAMLSSKLSEEERQLLKANDSIQLLQVDLQSSEKEKEKLSAELQRHQSLIRDVEELRREKQELCRRLSQQETLQDCADDNQRCQTLVSQLQDVQAQLMVERDVSENAQKQAQFLDRELNDAKKQLEKVYSACEEAQRKNGKLELQLREAYEVITEKNCNLQDKEDVITLLTREKEELVQENQNLVKDNEALHRLCDDLQAAAPIELPHAPPDTSVPGDPTSPAHNRQQQEVPEGDQHLYETLEGDEDAEEELLVCRHCQESFPGITRHELKQHEQSHRVCPFCTLMCDNMEQSVFEDHVYGHQL